MQGHLIEFMSSAAIKNIETNAAKKAELMEETDKALMAKVICLYDFTQFLKGVYMDNYQRSTKDMTRHFKMGEATVGLWFPRGDKFFKEGYTNPLYGISELDDKGVREAITEYKQQYLRAYKFWSENEP